MRLTFWCFIAVLAISSVADEKVEPKQVTGGTSEAVVSFDQMTGAPKPGQNKICQNLTGSLFCLCRYVDAKGMEAAPWISFCENNVELRLPTRFEYKAWCQANWDQRCNYTAQYEYPPNMQYCSHQWVEESKSPFHASWFDKGCGLKFCSAELQANGSFMPLDKKGGSVFLRLDLRLVPSDFTPEERARYKCRPPATGGRNIIGCTVGDAAAAAKCYKTNSPCWQLEGLRFSQCVNIRDPQIEQTCKSGGYNFFYVENSPSCP